jgi:hypothetical protein
MASRRSPGSAACDEGPVPRAGGRRLRPGPPSGGVSERARLRAHAGIVRAGGIIPPSVMGGSLQCPRSGAGAVSTPARRATVDPALEGRLHESIGVAPVERRPGAGRVALAVAALALVAAAGALLLLGRQCRAPEAQRPPPAPLA